MVAYTPTYLYLYLYLYFKRDSKSFFAYVRSKAKGKVTVGSVEDKNGA